VAGINAGLFYVELKCEIVLNFPGCFFLVDNPFDELPLQFIFDIAKFLHIIFKVLFPLLITSTDEILEWFFVLGGLAARGVSAFWGDCVGLLGGRQGVSRRVLSPAEEGRPGLLLGGGLA
jgi:hypothetical protein